MRKDKALFRLLSNPHVFAQVYSPRISRSIPVRIPLAMPSVFSLWVVSGFVSGVLLFLIISVGQSVQANAKTLAAMTAKRESIVASINYWQGIVKKNEGYRDGYFQLALLEYQLGDKEKSAEYLDKTMALDGNFQPGIAFREKLVGKE